jgi:hypothetical protein
LELTGAAGNGTRMQENEIGGAEEHQRVTAVRGWCGRLSTMARRRGGGPVRSELGEREMAGCTSRREDAVGLQTCLKSLKRTQWARGSVRDRQRACRPRRSSGRGGGGVARGEEGSEENYGGGRPESDT